MTIAARKLAEKYKLLIWFPSMKWVILLYTFSSVLVIVVLYLYNIAEKEIYIYFLVNFLIPFSFLKTSQIVDIRRSLGPIPLFNFLLILSALLSQIIFHNPTFSLFLPLITGLSYVTCRIFDEKNVGTLLFLLFSLLPGILVKQLYSITIMNLLSILVFEFLLIYNSTLERKLLGGRYRIFNAFLEYILANKPVKLEKALKEISARKEKLQIYSIAFFNKKGEIKGIFIVPYIHPGPFRDFGSSTLPSKIVKAFREKGVPALVFHGASSHERDLIRRSDVDVVVNHLLSMTFDKTKRIKISPFYRENSENFTTLYAKLDGHLFAIISSRERGLEDIPYEVVEEIAAKRLGEIILIDGHNRLDLNGENPRPLPSTPLYSELVNMLERLFNKDLPFHDKVKAGFYTTCTLTNFSNEVGIGGIAVAVIEIGDKRYFFAVFDGNNMVNPIRDKLLQTVKKKLCLYEGEVATTDTHITTGVTPKKSYSPVGEKTKLSALEDLVLTSLKRAIENMSTCYIVLERKDFLLPVLGNETIEKIHTLTSKALRALAAALSISLFIGFFLKLFSF
ncbi:MAG: hypothetical protein DRJ38_01760 [Thermoprotei archaeon]|nr:MAG: hypothetical protein DRJ38_01760 [Thermoprotei archaeon]